jgi:hypothetical protein
MKKQAGGMVFSTVFGNKVMRAKPFQYRDKNSQAQQLQRAHMATIAQMLTPLKSFIANAFDNVQIKKTPFSICLGNTLKNCFPGPSFSFNSNFVVIGDPSGSMIENVIVSMDVNQVCDIVWDKNTSDTSEQSAPLTLIFFDEATHESIIFPDVALRSAEVAQITFPVSWQNRLVTMHVQTIDYTLKSSHRPKKVVKMKSGNELALKVK